MKHRVLLSLYMGSGTFFADDLATSIVGANSCAITGKKAIAVRAGIENGEFVTILSGQGSVLLTLIGCQPNCKIQLFFDIIPAGSD